VVSGMMIAPLLERIGWRATRDESSNRRWVPPRRAEWSKASLDRSGHSPRQATRQAAQLRIRARPGDRRRHPAGAEHGEAIGRRGHFKPVTIDGASYRRNSGAELHHCVGMSAAGTGRGQVVLDWLGKGGFRLNQFPVRIGTSGRETEAAIRTSCSCLGPVMDPELPRT
jgi:hypothetical protein